MAVNGIIGINANRCASYERMRFLEVGNPLSFRRDKALEEGWGVVCLIYLTSHNRALCALTPLSAEAFRSCHRSRQVAYEAQARTHTAPHADPNRRKERQRPLPAGGGERLHRLDPCGRALAAPRWHGLRRGLEVIPLDGRFILCAPLEGERAGGCRRARGDRHACWV